MEDFESYRNQLQNWEQSLKERQEGLAMHSLRLAAFCRKLEAESHRAVARARRACADLAAIKKTVEDRRG